MSYKFRQFFIPDRMMGGLQRYVEHGIRPGGFLTAIITNDLCRAVEKADDENIANIPAYVAYLYNEAPAPSHGSVEKMEAWIAQHEARRVA